MDRDERLLKSERLLARKDYRKVYDLGERRNLPFFTVFVLKSDRDRSRLGITVTKQIGSAVIRNRCKRLVREAFRKNKHLVRGPVDLVFNVKRAMLSADHAAIADQLSQLLSQLDS